MGDPISPRTMWEERYSVEHYVYGTEPNHFLTTSLPSLPSGAALCLAEGEGRNAVFLAAAGFHVHSVDLAEAGVAKTHRLASERGLRVDASVGDLSTYDIGLDRWDVVVSIFAHMPPPVRCGLHARVVRALKPGGIFVLEAYTPAQIGRGTGGPQSAELTMTLEGLRDELDGLEFVHAVETEREVIEGSGHTGVGAVVQILARKPS